MGGPFSITNPMCIKAEGIDGSDKMIEKAKSIDPTHRYSCADLMTWNPMKKGSVHSEAYYLEIQRTHPKN